MESRLGISQSIVASGAHLAQLAKALRALDNAALLDAGREAVAIRGRTPATVTSLA